MARPILLEDGGEMDIQIRERRRWTPTFSRYRPGARVNIETGEVTGIPDPWPSGTVAYLVMRDGVDGTQLVKMGPDSGLDGTLEVVSHQIEGSLFVPAGLPFSGNLADWELVVWPAGEETDQVTHLRGKVQYLPDLLEI